MRDVETCCAVRTYDGDRLGTELEMPPPPLFMRHDRCTLANG